MTNAELASVYRNYIACLNAQDWVLLERFVAKNVEHNASTIGLSGYRKMLEKNFSDIPDLYFGIELLLVDPPHVASRLCFNCTPSSNFLGLEVNGRRVSFSENVFYKFEQSKIVQVWSIIDKATIEDQLKNHGDRANA
jgi:predicted ester cyclase